MATTTTTTATTQQQLLPPLSVKPSISMQSEDSVFSRLGATPLPDKEINTILNLHENLSFTQVMDSFDACMEKMTQWLDTAQMAVFTLEMALKEDQTDFFSSFDDKLLVLTFDRMEPLMSILIEVGHIVEDKLEMEEDHHPHVMMNTKKMHPRMSITKIQSEWSGVQHFMKSVLQQLDMMNEKKELTLLMENVLQQIDDLSIMMFQFQEKRHAAAAASSATGVASAANTHQHHNNTLSSCMDTSSESMSSPISATSSLFSPSTTTTATTTTTILSSSTINTSTTHLFNDPMSVVSAPRDDHILADIDSRVEPLFNDVQRIYASMTSRAPPEDPSGMLTRKHHMVQHRWETLRIEIDDLKEELKEDRWLIVFRQVADQVDVMIDGLDKTVTQCYTMIDQVREWYGSSAPSSPQHSHHHQQQGSGGNAFNRLSKTILRSFPHRHQQHSSSSSSSSTTTSLLPPPVDREKFRSVEKNFEAKYKYYTPSIGKMLGMLGSGIVSRVARDNGTSKRHNAMMQRWSTLKISMDTLRNKDLPETERMLTEGMMQSNSMGTTANSTSGWRSIRYKSPEPPSFQGGENLIRVKSSHNNNTLPKTNHHQSSYYQDQESYRRVLGGVRSVTPSSGGRTHHHKGVTQHPPRAASSMAFARDIRPSASESSSMDYPQRTRRTMTPMGTSHYHESRSFATATTKKSRVPPSSSRDDKEEASWMKPTKSTLMRTARRAQSVDQGIGQQQHNNRPKTPVDIPARSKTPNPGYTRRKSTTPNIPSRPKSSLGRQQQLSVPANEDHPRSVSPLRRTMTPSLIPRPKTPSSSSLRCASPGLIPRPRSSMQQHHPPPMPPIPASFQKSYHHETSPSLKKKQSMPALMHRTTSPFRMTHVPMRAPSPQYRRRRLSEEGHHDFSLMRGQPLNHHRHEIYTPNPKDPLDMEVGRIVNASPISVKCQKGPLGGGRYFFGNELNPSVGGGRKMYTCKLMTYDNNNTQRRGKAPAQNKVLVRVGGGWQDLEMFLLDHSNLMTAATSDIAVSRFK
ncbi:hypothetical protein BDA99DRAFT_606018 [Phascolomyces articulosus]|uniref:GAR domain-containing protein n=1 Tax=Phascolomyces articulosus TaxID=60185 RepID=A0AAD5JWZ9_9FUNG|nr:hypothetical protein BDA99DRAFT_606018 [Phascolomyces articulosus]